MRFLHIIGVVALSLSSVVSAASSWKFQDATVSVSGKDGDSGEQKLTPDSPISQPVTLPAGNSLKLALTATEGKKGKRPHQAFLTLQEPDTGLEESFALTIKDTGKGEIKVAPKDLPYQLRTSTKPLKASIVIGSFGSAAPYKAHAFDLVIQTDPIAPPAVPSPPERYTAKPEIHHIFHDGPHSPPQIISLFFTLAIVVSLPALMGGWLLLGGNVGHLQRAFGAQPVAHGLFLGSIIAMEGVFFMYYATWNLFQTLPVAAVIGTVAYVSGSKALTEVQERRLAGER